MSGGPERTLLVEDDALLGAVVTRQLEQRGHEVTHVTTAAAARALAGPFGVGIFDLQLPDGDGITVAKALLARAVVDRAVFFTATTSAPLLAAARAIGPVFDKGAGPSLGQLMDELCSTMNGARR